MSTSLISNAAEHRHADPLALAAALAERIADDLRAGVAERGAASLVLSGGSTPRPLFERLSQAELPWRQVAVALADERWVPPEHPDSNERLARETLMVEAAAEALFVGLVNDAPTPEAGRDACERAHSLIARPFDVVVLGMGGDGHTASLFPDAAELDAGLDSSSNRTCLAVHPPAAPHARMSLTLPALLDCRRLILHITGAGKWSVYQRALQPGPAAELPIRAVLQSGRVEVWWAP